MHRPDDVDVALDRVRDGHTLTREQFRTILGYIENFETDPDQQVRDMTERFVRAVEAINGDIRNLTADRDVLRERSLKLIAAETARDDAAAAAVVRETEAKASTRARLWEIALAAVKNPAVWLALAGGGGVATAVQAITAAFSDTPVETVAPKGVGEVDDAPQIPE